MSKKQFIRCKRKILILESEEIALLGLKDGTNEITFTVTSKFQVILWKSKFIFFKGTVTIKSRIFLWNNYDKIVISDIDGTITKSDVLGHMMYFVGKDWVHSGVTKVLSQIQNNGYRIMYLSSRTIGIVVHYCFFCLVVFRLVLQGISFKMSILIK